MGRVLRVSVTCAICAKVWEVKPSRAKQNNAITCSKTCLAELRRRNRISHVGSEHSRRAVCDTCMKPFERKPSQLAKYSQNFCSRTCRAVSISGPRPGTRTGDWFPCELCGTRTWRTDSTKRAHVYCSRTCANNAPRTPRVLRIAKPCATCDAMMILLPSAARRYRFCSWSCAAQDIQGKKRGLPGRPWAAQQRGKLSKTLLVKYQTEWVQKPASHAELMTGPGNPQWRGGRSLQGYAPGFTETLKRRIADRDGNRCRACGKPRGHGTHAVHHIDGGKTNHDESNLVLLCFSCHALIHQGKIVLRSRT